MSIKSISVHFNAAADLRQLWEDDRNAAAAVAVVLEQLGADPNAIDILTTFGNNNAGTHRINVRTWESARGLGNLWRFRVLDTPATNYRVVYGYHWQTRQLCVLAVVLKTEFDYELNSDIAKRILADWRELAT